MAGLLDFELPLDVTLSQPICDPIDSLDSPTTEDNPPRFTFPKPKHLKRMSQTMLLGCQNLPSTTQDWKKLLSNVKRDYQDGKYRQCLSRCNEVLDNVRQLLSFQAAYLIYLHFYAACALEMQVRNLHHSSAYRIKTLGQAQDHFARASALVKIEDEDMNRRSRSPSTASSYSHSPSTSHISWQSMSSSRVMSPTPSLTFSDCESRRVVKRKKRVRFSETVHIESIAAEPIIRPDSPTLGFDDWMADTPFDRGCTSPITEMKSALTSSPATTFMTLSEEMELEDPFAQDRAIHRYTTILDSLRREIPTHLAWVQAEVAARNKLTMHATSNGELRALDLQTRIQRLKENGWQRRRFDVTRYEALRESAMADLMG